MNKGFTIIETLVAITILMISIAGPLTIAHKGLLAAIYAHDQVIASYLAQDALEYIKNVRDDSLIANAANPNSDWLRNLSGCTQAAPCSVDTLGGDPSVAGGISSCGATCATTARLYARTDGSGYGYDSSSGTPTQFYRYFYLRDIDSSSVMAQLVVQVDWNTGLVTNSVVYENRLFKTLR